MLTTYRVSVDESTATAFGLLTATVGAAATQPELTVALQVAPSMTYTLFATPAYRVSVDSSRARFSEESVWAPEELSSAIVGGVVPQPEVLLALQVAPSMTSTNHGPWTSVNAYMVSVISFTARPVVPSAPPTPFSEIVAGVVPQPEVLLALQVAPSITDTTYDPLT